MAIVHGQIFEVDKKEYVPAIRQFLASTPFGAALGVTEADVQWGLSQVSFLTHSYSALCRLLRQVGTLFWLSCCDQPLLQCSRVLNKVPFPWWAGSHTPAQWGFGRQCETGH